MQTVPGKFREMKIKQLGSSSPILSKYSLHKFWYVFNEFEHKNVENA